MRQRLPHMPTACLLLRGVDELLLHGSGLLLSFWLPAYRTRTLQRPHPGHYPGAVLRGENNKNPRRLWQYGAMSSVSGLRQPLRRRVHVLPETR